MAGISVGGGNSHGRRSVDSEINMIPMIDLLMVTVSFLLITAVWTHMSRLEGTTRAPSQQDSNKPEEIVARMHVEVPDAQDQPIRLSMQRGPETLDQTTIERNDTKNIGKKIDAMQHAHPVDLASDMSHVVVLHVGNEMRYGEMVAVMDSIAQVPDPRTRHGEPNFHVNLATK